LALLGTHVDATLAVDPAGAKQIVDAMGGLNVKVERNMDYDDEYGNLHIHLKAGEQFLNGGQVLEYIRFRHDIESDWGRMRRQQQVVHEIARQLGEPQNWVKMPRLVALARKDVKTSLSDAQLAALVELYRGVPADNIRTLTLPGRADFVGDVSASEKAAATSSGGRKARLPLWAYKSVGASRRPTQLKTLAVLHAFAFTA
jgi:anionic cell wall polymer biosynthesis LytR-Cps2A-Psr (LCP) family protein